MPCGTNDYGHRKLLETEDVKIKGVKFYTMNDGRNTLKQIGEIALGRAFKGLSVQDW